MITTNSNSISIGACLIQRLYEHGVHHVFGVPGDYVPGFKLKKVPFIKAMRLVTNLGALDSALVYAYPCDRAPSILVAGVSGAKA